MPVELKTVEELVEVSKRAVECRVKEVTRGPEKGKIVKVKARTRRVLYTLKVPKEKLDEVLSKLKCGRIVFVDTGEVREVAKESK